MITTPASGPPASPQPGLTPAAWLCYLAAGLEILFMISPAAGYFYALYGPALNALEHWAATAWLTQFFLPHLSTTRSSVLNALPWIGGFCALVGATGFLVAAVQLYWSKFRRLGIVTTGLYRFCRHPQYASLVLLGFGCLLLWPRFLVLLAYVSMLLLYRSMATLEERQCAARFGGAYRDYQTRAGGLWLPVRSAAQPAAGRAMKGGAGRRWVWPRVLALVASVLVAFGFREYTLTQITAHYEKHMALLSPALLDGELLAAYRTALADHRVRTIVTDRADRPLLVHVLPADWHLADLPVEIAPGRGGHDTPVAFDRHCYKLLFSRVRTHQTEAEGKDIVRSAHGIDPLLVVGVDIGTDRVTAVETPPAHVRWGDISTPLF